MSADYYEIIELANGDIALRQLDGVDEAPLVTIRFAKKTQKYLKEHYVAVARAMLTAGIETATELVMQPDDIPADELLEAQSAQGQVVH